MLGRKGFTFSWSAWPVLVFILLPVAGVVANEWSGNRIYSFLLAQSCRLFATTCEVQVPISIEVLKYRSAARIRSRPVVIRLAPGSVDEPEHDYVITLLTEKLAERGVVLVEDEWKANLVIGVYVQRSLKNHPFYPSLKSYGESEYFANFLLSEMSVKERGGRYDYLDYTGINEIRYNCYGHYAMARSCYTFFVENYVDVLMGEHNIESKIVLRTYNLAQ